MNDIEIADDDAEIMKAAATTLGTMARDFEPLNTILAHARGNRLGLPAFAVCKKLWQAAIWPADRLNTSVTALAPDRSPPDTSPITARNELRARAGEPLLGALRIKVWLPPLSAAEHRILGADLARMHGELAAVKVAIGDLRPRGGYPEFCKRLAAAERQLSRFRVKFAGIASRRDRETEADRRQPAAAVQRRWVQ